ncbi:profilin-2-like [Nicotiana tabacum]|uniref:Profilin n=1 Tax=Nicotiana tabacum TaxID=4097 RepID=A0A1S3ZXP9_TOBAC|nr:PREDICTED: profilin-2-like [Nicotiana tabacum]
MSWQAYVDDQLMGSGYLSAAAITGHDGGLRAKSSTFPEEIKAIMDGFTEPGLLYQNGVPLGGTKYLVVEATSASIYGKKGAGGIIIRKTVNTIIIGIYNENVSPGNSAMVVEKLGDYLEENGY